MSSPAKPNLPWCETVEPDPVIVFQYWASLAIWIINMLLGGWSIYKFKFDRDKSKPVFKVLFIIIASLFIITPAGFAFGTQAGWECWYDFLGWEAVTMVGLVSYQYGLVILSLFFILRLRTISSAGMTEKFELHKLTLLILIITLLIQMICPIMSCYYFLQAWDPIVRKTALWWVHVHTYTNVIVNTFVLILFIKRILLLTEIQMCVSPITSVASQSNSVINVDIETKNQKKKMIDQKMLSTGIRYMVCAVFAMLSSVIVVFWGIIRSEVTEFHNDSKFVLRMRGIHSFLTTFDGTINLIFLILQFSVGGKIYVKCCHGTHQCFQKCFMKCLHLNIKGKSELQLANVITKSTQSGASNATTKSAGVSI